MTSFINFKTLKVFKTTALFLTALDNVDGSETHSLIDIFPRRLERIHLTRWRYLGLGRRRIWETIHLYKRK